MQGDAVTLLQTRSLESRDQFAHEQAELGGIERPGWLVCVDV